MTTQAPPYPYFSTIVFNSSYFSNTSSTGGLSQTQADARYLIKISPDAATATESFSSGIITGSVDSANLSDALMIGNAANKTGNIYLGDGFGSNGTIFVGINTTTTVLSGTVNIGNDPTVPITLTGITMANYIECSNLDAQYTTLSIGGNSTLSTATTIGSGLKPTSILGNTITLNNPLTLANQVPTAASSQLGSKYSSPTITWSTSANGVLCTSSSLPIGVYHIDFSITTKNTFAYNFIYLSPEDVNWRCPFVQINTGNVDPSGIATGSYTFNITFPQTLSLLIFAANTNALNYGECNIYRIA